MTKYRLKPDSISTAGPVTFGDAMPGYWYADQDMVPGSADLGISEAEVEALLEANPNLPIEAVKGKGKAKRAKAAPKGEDGSVDPDEVLADVDPDQIGLRETPAEDEEAKA